MRLCYVPAGTTELHCFGLFREICLDILVLPASQAERRGIWGGQLTRAEPSVKVRKAQPAPAFQGTARPAESTAVFPWQRLPPLLGKRTRAILLVQHF